MPWVYLDDHWDEHPKMLSAYEIDLLAPTLFISGLAYVRRNNTDGLIPGPKVRGLLGWRAKSQRALVCAGLWREDGPGAAVTVHDWNDWNTTSERKQDRSASARNAAQVRWSKHRREKEKP
jgi:hypothetical protein